MHVAIVTSEAVPYAKTGGLADVTTALSKELVKLGHEVTLMLPKYSGITMKPTALATAKLRLPNSVSGRIGSPMRSSTSTKASVPATLTATRTRIAGDPQGKLVPPRLVNRMMALSETASRRAPG